MNRATVAAVGSIGAILVTGCTGQIDSATNVTQVAATLNASFTCTQGEAGEYWLAHRRVGVTAAWSETGRRTFNCTRAASDQRAYQLTGLNSAAVYEARLCADPAGSPPANCTDADGTVHGAVEDSRTNRDVTYFRFTTLGAPVPGGLPVRQRVCMNTHMNYSGSGYADVAAVRAKLDYLGVDCVRDVLPPDGNLVNQPSRFNQLGRQVIAICGGYFTSWWWENSEARCVSEARSRINRLVAVEGMNEPYCQDRTAFTANQTRLRNHMVRLRDGAAGTGIAVYSVSMCHPEWYTAAAVPGIVNNMHSYSPPGQFPRMGPASSGDSVESWMSRSRFSDSGQFASTEMGTYDPVTALGGNQTLMARYQLIHTLNHLYKGIQRFAFYELQDEYPGGEDFGFWGANGSRRLAADAMRNFLTVLGEARTGPAVGFTYTVSDPANRLLHLPARAADGNHYIALWNQQSTAARNVTLHLSAPRPITVVRPINSPTGENRAASTSHAIPLGDDPLIAIIRP
jgi:hypothetical protein